MTQPKTAAKLEQSVGKRILVIPSALVFAACLAAVAMFFRMSDTSNWVSHTLEVRLAASSLLNQIENAETGERGYVLTRQEDYLKPYREASARIKPSFEKLRRLIAGNEVQRKAVSRLGPLIGSKLAITDKIVSLTREGKKEQASALDVPANEAMDRIRAIIGEIAAAEKNLLRVREREERRARGVLLALILCGLAGAFALTAVAIRSQGRLVRSLQDEAAKRETAEASLRQSQKMEAIGQLTGGVAHDFNNLLTVILGNLDTILRRLPSEPAGAVAQTPRPLDAAMQGARSAAKLTHRLLAFSRKQPLDPVPLDLNKSIAGISELLMRTVGTPVTVETVLAGGLWLTLADANQFENVLVNLAINAKDAMPEGGKITIETANAYLDEAYAASFGDVAPGQYAVESVTDTGTGIPPAVLERVFEPFFTTKEAGMGTGLGLSMVHGFVKQSGGHVRIYSEVGHGTSVKMYLPRLFEESTLAAVPKALDHGSKPPAPPGTCAPTCSSCLPPATPTMPSSIRGGSART